MKRRRRTNGTALKQAARAGLVFTFLAAVSFLLRAQEPAQDQGQASQPMTVDRTMTSLHGVVRNAATGEGLPRALVRIEGDANTGALTDGEGRFEIADIPVGPQEVEVRKPGFLDYGTVAAGTTSAVGPALMAVPAGGHNVLVAAQMPDVIFTLTPAGAIRGQVELSTGEPAGGIALALVRRGIESGRAVWQPQHGTKTSSDGTFRFGGLEEGDYALFSEPAMDNDLDGTQGGAGERRGFASVYYPDAREPSGAGRIHVESGRETQANLTLTLGPFESVTAVVLLPPGSVADREGMNLSVEVVGSGGQQLPYLGEYNQETHTIQALLPDGTYTLLVTSVPGFNRMRLPGNPNAGILTGSVDVTVQGHAVPNLRMALSPARPNPVQVVVQHGASSSTPTGTVNVFVSQAGGWIDDSMVSAYAQGTLPGPLQATYTKPGMYWVHTSNQGGLCEASFTAGGANLAREPVSIGPSGSAATMELTMRDDCASLQLSLPEAMDSISAGEEPFFTVYAIPDFDSTSEVQPMTLRASTGGSVTLSGLTPGDYHMYTFPGAVQLAYRNREALAALANRGQAISLSPGSTGNLVVEAPGQ